MAQITTVESGRVGARVYSENTYSYVTIEIYET